MASGHAVVLAFRLNGAPVQVAVAPHRTLVEVLREQLDLTGTKQGCDKGTAARARCSSTARRCSLA